MTRALETAATALWNKKSFGSAVEIGEVSEAALAAFGRLAPPEAAWLLHEPAAVRLAIGAVRAGRPVGLALLECEPESRMARLLAVSVDAAHRRRGIGRSLLAHAAGALRQRGFAGLSAEFVADADAPAEQAAFLTACGFPSFHPGVHICSGPLTAPSDQRWFQLRLPAAFTVDGWSSLTAEERSQIELDAGSEYPELLSPFAGEPGMDAERSLLLRYQGAPAGWMLVEVMDETTLLFKTMYVYKRHQRMARGAALFAEAIRRAVAEGVFPDGIFFVEDDNVPMREFTRKYFCSPLLRKTVLWRSAMPL